MQDAAVRVHFFRLTFPAKLPTCPRQIDMDTYYPPSEPAPDLDLLKSYFLTAAADNNVLDSQGVWCQRLCCLDAITSYFFENIAIEDMQL